MSNVAMTLYRGFWVGERWYSSDCKVWIESCDGEVYELYHNTNIPVLAFIYHYALPWSE